MPSFILFRSNLSMWHSPSRSFQTDTIDFLRPSVMNYERNVKCLTEGIDLSWDQTLVRLGQRDEDLHFPVELDKVLGILAPHLILLFGVLQRGATRVGLGPSALEVVPGVLGTELDAHE